MKRTVPKKSLSRMKPRQSFCTDCEQKTFSLSKNSPTPKRESIRRQYMLQPSRNPLVELLNWECKVILSRICKGNIPFYRSIDAELLAAVIQGVVKAQSPKNRKVLDSISTRQSFKNLKSGYYRGLGWICAHVANLYKKKEQSISIVLKLLELSDFDIKIKVDYGSASLKFHLADTPPSQRKAFKGIDFTPILRRYISSMLFEYLPEKYSQFVIQLYLHEYQEMLANPRAWQANPRPQQFYRLMCSVIHYVIFTKNPIDQTHLQSLCFNAYMGVVEWPIVIANRSMFEYPPINTPQLGLDSTF